MYGRRKHHSQGENSRGLEGQRRRVAAMWSSVRVIRAVPELHGIRCVQCAAGATRAVDDRAGRARECSQAPRLVHGCVQRCVAPIPHVTHYASITQKDGRPLEWVCVASGYAAGTGSGNGNGRGTAMVCGTHLSRSTYLISPPDRVAAVSLCTS